MKTTRRSGAQGGGAEGEEGPAPEGGVGEEEQGQQDAELGGRDGGPGGGGDKLVPAEILHDESRHAHPHAGAQDGHEPGKAGDEKELEMLQVAPQQGGGVQVDDPHEEGHDREQRQGEGQKKGDVLCFDGTFLLMVSND